MIPANPSSPNFLIFATATLLLVTARYTVTSATLSSSTTGTSTDDIDKDHNNDDITVERCRDNRRRCYNNSKCVRNRKIDPTHGDYGYRCDCAPSPSITTGSDGASFAGVECEYKASVYCDDAKDDQFCTNGGTCGSYVSGGRYYTGCHCPVGYSGAHCQYPRGGGGGTPGEALVLDIADNFYTRNVPVFGSTDRHGGDGVLPSLSSNIPVDGCRNDQQIGKLAKSHKDEGKGKGKNDVASTTETTKTETETETLVERLLSHNNSAESTTPKPKTPTETTDAPTKTKQIPQPKPLHLQPPYIYTGIQVPDNIIHAILHNSTTEIHNGAFSRRKNLKSIDLMPRHDSSALVRIGDFAFRHCRSLLSITVPASVVEIGESAFAMCDLLEEVYVPAKTRIGKNAFRGCERLPKTLWPVGYTHEFGRGL